MTQAKGSSARVMLIEEATWGTTPGTPSGYVIPVSGIGGNWFTRNLIDNPTLRANRNPSAPVRGNTSVEGSFTVPLGLEYIGWIQKHAVGDMDTSGSGTYTHVSKCGFSEDDAGELEPGLSIEVGFTDIDQYHVYNGCKINSFTVNGSSEGVCTVEVNVVGQGYTQATSSEDSTPTTYSDTTIDHFLMTMEEGGGAISNVKECSLTFSNNLDTSQYVIGSEGERGSLPSGIASCTGSITALFENDTLLTKAENHTESSLSLIWTSGNYSWTLHVPELVYEPASPTVSGPDGVVATLNFRAYYANDADATILKATLVNTTADY